MAQSPDEMPSAVAASLAERTGRSLGEWIALVQESGLDPLDQGAVRRWLRSEHGVPQNSQWAIADAAARAAGWVPPTVAEYVDGQYAGAKAGLRPIYDTLAAIITGLGDDVQVEGRSSYTPFARGRQFAAVAAATRDRSTWGCVSPTRPPAAGCSRPRVPARPRTSWGCAACRTWMMRCGTSSSWPTSRTVSAGDRRARPGDPGSPTARAR